MQTVFILYICNKNIRFLKKVIETLKILSSKKIKIENWFYLC